MSILLTLWKGKDPADWKRAFAELLPHETVWLESEVPDPAKVNLAIVGLRPERDFAHYPNLQAALLLSAGLDHLVADGLPDVPIVRLADPAMAHSMAIYATYWTIHFQREFEAYRKHQAEGRWQPLPTSIPADFPVGILGFGTIGRTVADMVSSLGYPVNAWSRSGPETSGVRGFAGTEQLDEFLTHSRLVVNLLPSTPQTAGLLNAERLEHLAPGSFLINIGRGSTIDTDALIAALDNKTLAGVALDVFENEPLEPASPLWNHPLVHMTPHISGDTLLATAPQVVAANITRIRKGQDPSPIFDPTRGY